MSDLISRQAAIANAISGRTREVDGEKWIRVSEVRESIKTLPSAEPVRHRLKQSDAGMTVAEYRERMIQAFHNADCDSLIAVVVLPTEKEFQHLEWLLKKEYVPFLEKAKRHGKWIETDEYDEFYGRLYRCSNCKTFVIEDVDNYCPYCGADMRGEK